jgi:hypothetical protein
MNDGTIFQSIDSDNMTWTTNPTRKEQLMHALNLLNAYQDFTDTTAIYPKENEHAYVALGLVDEVAELHEKICNYINSPGHTRSDASLVLDEAGDVLWYIARELRRLGLTFADLADVGYPPFQEEASLAGLRDFLVIKAGFLAGRAKKTLRDGSDYTGVIVVTLKSMLVALDNLARFWNSNLILVSVSNQSKLASRLDRGMIKGDGDQR